MTQTTPTPDHSDLPPVDLATLENPSAAADRDDVIEAMQDVV